MVHCAPVDATSAGRLGSQSSRRDATMGSAQYQTVIFDLDGTLLNTLDDLTSSTNHALAEFGLPPRTTDEVRAFVGNGIANLIRLAVPADSSEELMREVHDAFDEHYAAHNLDATAPYLGVCELVARLRSNGLKCCVVSNKGDYAVQPLVRHFFPGLFDFVCGEREREGIRRKPWPDTVLQCMRACDSDPGRCVYVGDSEVDVLTAHNAGIECITVTWGFRTPEQLLEAGAGEMVDTVKQLEHVLLNGVPHRGNA